MNPLPVNFSSYASRAQQLKSKARLLKQQQQQLAKQLQELSTEAEELAEEEQQEVQAELLTDPSDVSFDVCNRPVPQHCIRT